MNILTILQSTGALLTDDHFVYTSGKHGSVYINKDILYTHPDKASLVGKAFAKHCKEYDIDVVAGPALGGIILSQWTAYHLSRLLKKEVQGVYTEKTPEKEQIFTRGYDNIVKGKNVLVVEDLVTTGSSVKKVVESVKKAKGKVVLAAVMVDRSPLNARVTKASLGAPFFALGRLPVEIFEPSNCPLCQMNIPINTSVGHGKKFIQQKGDK